MLTIEITDRLNKLDAKILDLLADKHTIEQKMFDCGSILKKLQSGNIIVFISSSSIFIIIIIVVVSVVIIITVVINNSAKRICFHLRFLGFC